ncbi:hypothetical protein, partial [Roseibium sp. RKSG952]|uniref:hypothetical protein n=1 Tax=Roseibium sp. RKSG952 TaxID=2529384 RepID=UPI0012BCBDF9
MTDNGSGTVSDSAARGDFGRNVPSMSNWLMWAGQSKVIKKGVQDLDSHQKTAVLDILKRMSGTCKTRGSFFDYSSLERLVTAIEQDIPSMEVLVDPYLWPRKLASRQAVMLGRGLLKNISDMREGRQLVQHELLYQYGGVKKAFKLAAAGDFGAFDDIARALESLKRDYCGDPIAGNMAKSIDYVCACMGSKLSMGRVSQSIAQMRSDGVFATSYEDAILRAAEDGWQFLAWSEPGPQWDTAAELLYLASVECDFLKDDPEARQTPS